ncbi:hypothetical protein FA15DRAFT_377368 [Coprinopsis marcescibilis]|uniref:Cytochrome b561 domain-containing protein n=1 Tax=Coprinopsis marcescibilis TaxID=230819 RepID=A0A5C3KY03_COPMA|nr:hypothetical protein FA15DRAFT_377368 [Coprinopsis marcescibilis]
MRVLTKRTAATDFQGDEKGLLADNEAVKQQHGDDHCSSRRGRPDLPRIIALASIGVLAAITYVAVLKHDPTSLGWFALHPLLQAFSLFQFAYSLVCLYYPPPDGPKNPMMPTLDIPTWALAFPASMVVGTLAVWHNKNLRGAEHCTTWHGILGWVCTFWMVAQGAIGGASMLWEDKLQGGGPKAKLFWKCHSLSGYLIFPAAIVTAHLGGTWSTWAERNMPLLLRVLGYTVMPLVLAIGFYLLWAREQEKRRQGLVGHATN